MQPQAVFGAELLEDGMSLRGDFPLTDICQVHMHRRQNHRSHAVLGNWLTSKVSEPLCWSPRGIPS